MGTQKSLQTKFDRFLQNRSATPTALGKSPRELLINRQPRLRLSVLRDKSLIKNNTALGESVTKNTKPFLVLISLT